MLGRSIGIGYDSQKETNRNILLKYVLLALDDREMLSKVMVTEDSLPKAKKMVPRSRASKAKGKTYTYQVYGEMLDGRHGKQVYFANTEDIKVLLSFLEKKVGESLMTETNIFIGNESNAIQKIGLTYLKKWKAGEEWPLA